MKDKNWSDNDVVLYVAEIANISSESTLEDLNYRVNRDLTIEIAEEAKAEGVS